MPHTLPALAWTENKIRQRGRKEQYLAVRRVSWSRRSWSSRLVLQPLAARVPLDRFSRKHQRSWVADRSPRASRLPFDAPRKARFVITPTVFRHTTQSSGGSLAVSWSTSKSGHAI